jgi:hypothetical protein
MLVVVGTLVGILGSRLGTAAYEDAKEQQSRRKIFKELREKSQDS